MADSLFAGFYCAYVAGLALAGFGEGSGSGGTPTAVIVLIGLLWVIPPLGVGAAFRRPWLLLLPSAVLAPIAVIGLVSTPGNEKWWVNVLALAVVQTALLALGNRLRGPNQPISQ